MRDTLEFTLDVCLLAFLSGEKYEYETLYTCRESSTNQLFFAKQTQFTNCPNRRNYLYNNELCNFYQSDKSQKQTQTNPIQSQNKPNSNPIAERAKMNINVLVTKEYENKTAFRRIKNKANSNPISKNFEGLDNNLNSC